MKKEKNFLKSLLAGVCAASLLFGAVSCANSDDDDSTTTPVKTPTPGDDSGNKGKQDGQGDKDGEKPKVPEQLGAGGSYSVLADGTSAGRKAVTAPSTQGTITLTVGSGTGTTYPTIAAALSAAASASGDCVITLGKGTYNEDGLSYSGNNNLKISGQGNAEYGLDVVIYGKGSDVSQEKGRSTLAIAGKGNIVLENLTIKSSRQNQSGDAQAEVIGTDGTGNLAAYNCSFLSGQDTLRTVAKAWFYKCYIEGDVDFLWMEYTNGVAALYEECVLRAISSRTTKAYFTAPRLGLSSKVGKGVVVYNCTLEVESAKVKAKETDEAPSFTVYLGRNPWASSALSDYYEQVAFIGSKLYLPEGVTLHSDVWASKANGTADQKYIGFKTDDYFPAGKYGTRIGSSFIAQEYAGRENILNRLFVVASSKFQKDTDGYWNVAKVVSDNNWTVTSDSSKSLLDGEKEVVKKTYDFSKADAGAYVDSTITIDGFSKHSNSENATGGTGKTITIPVTGKCIVTVKGDYSGWGTIKAGSQGEGVYNINSGATSKYLECGYVVYDAAATSVVITAATTSYINSITVEYDDTLSFVPVTGISVAAASSTFTVGVANTMKATVTPDTASNSAVKWTSSDATVGTIDEFSGEVKFLKAGNVTFTATARDGSGVTKSITCSPEAATWTSAEWYYTKDASKSATASGIGADASNVAGENVSVFSFNAYSGIALGGTKTVSTISGDKTVSMGLKMDGNGKFTFAVTKAATLKLKQAYIKTVDKNYSGYITISSSDGSATMVSGATSAISADTDYEWTLTPGTYTIARYTGNTSPIIYARVELSN